MLPPDMKPMPELSSAENWSKKQDHLSYAVTSFVNPLQTKPLPSQMTDFSISST